MEYDSVVSAPMFDTVYFDQERECLGEHPDWNVKITKSLGSKGNDHLGHPITAHYNINPDKQMRIKLSGNSVTGYKKVEVSSLATLLHGQNGYPLMSPAEVEAAFYVLDGLLAQVSRPTGPRSFVRVDIGVNLPIAYGDIEHGLWGSALKQEKNTPEIYPRESITFRRGSTYLQFYDKAKSTQAKDVKGGEKLESVTRVELRLYKQDAMKNLGGGSDVKSLDFLKSYQVLREHVLQVAPATEPIKVVNIDTFLAWLYRKDPALAEPYIVRPGGKSKRATKRRKISRMAATIGENEIPWCKVFPEARPPVQVQLYYPTALKKIVHPGLATHPVTRSAAYDERVIPLEQYETYHARLIRSARYKYGLGEGPAGDTLPVTVDSTKLGAVWERSPYSL